ncbi:MAG: DUF4445 domain-containing protein [Clostridiales bacterium]|nr:DUF4445 domain-containing protein [Clostridiales bacterium]
METLRIVYDGIEKVIPFYKGDSLLSVLRNNGYEISANCGGNGTCNKCKVYLVEGGKVTAVSSCKTLAKADMRVIVPSVRGEGLVTDAKTQTDGESGIGLALDIGTTTLAFYFVDLATGETLKRVSCLNPQSAFGADVISRVEYATNHGVNELTQTLKMRINGVISAFSEEFHQSVKRLAVTGNTVMLHIFAGEEIASFGKYPFTPAFLESRKYAKGLGYQAEEVLLLPSVSSFVGADITCGAIATNLTANGTNLLVDLGTNGEMLLSHQGKLYATSVAAGPAFEGAGISCGMGGVEGAISQISEKNGNLTLTTVGNQPPKGICGSGLIDGIAYLLKQGVIDETGAFQTEEDQFAFAPNVLLTAGDVRAFQLAKSAVRAGIETLLKVANITQVDRLFVCGGMGFYLNKDSAVTVGLFPAHMREKIVSAGNTAGLGAKQCLLSAAARKKASALSVSAEVIPLSTRADFTELFMEHMFF